MNDRSPWLACLGLVAGVLATGCSGYQDPSIAIRDAALTEATEEALAVRFTVELHNPNPEPLELLQFDYDVSIDGRKAYSGVRAAQATLAGEGSRELALPAVIVRQAMGWEAGATPAQASYSIRGRLQYITPGEVAQILFDTGVRKPRASFKGQGTVALGEPAAANATASPELARSE